MGSAFDPMSEDCVGSDVGWLDSMFADVAEIQLIVFAWNATMVQAKTLKSKLEVQETSEEAETDTALGNRHNSHICQVCLVHNGLSFADLILLQ